MPGIYVPTPRIIFESIPKIYPHSQLAEQYGADVASEVLARSRSNLHLDVFPPVPYASGAQVNPSPIGTKQDTFPPVL
jgi:hypothetical protein